VNLDVIGKANYAPQVRIWEDLDFNLRISGMARQSGGTALRLSSEKEVLGACGAWLSHETTSAAFSSEEPQPILREDDAEGPAIICKCYRFEYNQDQAASRKGGCSGDVQHIQKDDMGDADEDEGGDDDFMDLEDTSDLEIERKRSVVETLKNELKELNLEYEPLLTRCNDEDLDRMDELDVTKEQKVEELRAAEEDLRSAEREAARREKVAEEARQRREEAAEEARQKAAAAAAAAAAAQERADKEKQLLLLKAELEGLKQQKAGYIQILTQMHDTSEGKKYRDEIIRPVNCRIKEVEQMISALEAELKVEGSINAAGGSGSGDDMTY